MKCWLNPRKIIMLWYLWVPKISLFCTCWCCSLERKRRHITAVLTRIWFNSLWCAPEPRILDKNELRLPGFKALVHILLETLFQILLVTGHIGGRIWQIFKGFWKIHSQPAHPELFLHGDRVTFEAWKNRRRFRFWDCFSTIRFSKTVLLAWLRSSHGVLSMIFGFLTKFWL